jgi:hypothetical protein
VSNGCDETEKIWPEEVFVVNVRTIPVEISHTAEESTTDPMFRKMPIKIEVRHQYKYQLASKRYQFNDI